MGAMLQPIVEPDSAAMTAHLEHLFGGFLHGFHDGLIELAWTDTSPDASGRYRLAHAELFGTDRLDDLVARAVELNRQPMCNTYIGAALRRPDTAPFGRCKDEDFLALTAAYVDIDDAEAAQKARDRYAAAKPTQIVITGSDPYVRVQCWWLLEEPIDDPARHVSLIRGLTHALGGDVVVTNPSRVMRLAGSLAWPHKVGRKLELTRIHPLAMPGQPVYMAEHLERVFPPVAPMLDVTPGTVDLSGITRAAGPLGLPGKIADGREQYMRDTTLACLIQYVGENGASPSVQELFDLVWPQYERNVDLSRPGRGPEEVAEKCRAAIRRFEEGKIKNVETPEKAVALFERKKAARKALDAASPASIMRILSPETILGESAAPRFSFEKISDLRRLPPTKWLVPGWVPEGSTGIFYGKWAAGKSFIGFDVSLHLAYGMQDWHGVPLPGEPCDVLVIAREGHQGFIQRIDAFKKHHGIIEDTNRIVFMRASVSFMRDEEFVALCEAIKAQKTRYRLVMIDTVARVIPGVEMGTPETVTLFMERCSILGELTGAATIGVHHQNKSGAMMGSIYFEANADFVFEVTRLGEEDGPLRAGEITCTKMKDGEDRWKRAVVYDKVCLTEIPSDASSLVVASIHEGAPQAHAKDTLPSKDVCRAMLAAIGAAWRSGTPWSSHARSSVEGRYAVKNIAVQFGTSAAVAERLIKDWLANGVLAFRQRDQRKNRPSGLEVTGSLD